MAVFTQSFLARSNQQWKLAVGFACLVTGFGVVLMAVTGSVRTDDTGFVLLLLSGFGLMIVAALWSSLSIRCPNCRGKFLWIAVSQEELGNWGRVLLTRCNCPVCGHLPTG